MGKASVITAGSSTLDQRADRPKKMEDGEFQAADRHVFLSRAVLDAQRASFLVKIALKGERT